METSFFAGESGNAPLALLFRMCDLYDPLVPEDCSCGCSWRFGEEGVDVNTRVLSAVTSACRTSICKPDTKKFNIDNLRLFYDLQLCEKKNCSDSGKISVLHCFKFFFLKKLHTPSPEPP